MLLYWQLLEYAIGRKCTQFDFGRSTCGQGTFRFKKQWGATPVRLQWYDYNADGEPTEEDTRPGRTRRIAESVWSRLPLSVANSLGPKVRRFVSL